jgi:peptide subunit release factor 1 (eRF1)
MSINAKLEKLASFEPNGFPFVSLYLNAQADQHGRDNFAPFLRKEINRHARTFAEGSFERECFERDAGRIELYLREELEPSANGLAIFACAGANNYFEAIQLNVPIQANELHVADSPHLYPLARLIDQHPSYVALVADTDAARLFVFDLGRKERGKQLDNTGRSLAPDGVRSQLRYQRRVEKYNLLHAKEVVEMLGRVVREEAAEHIIIAGDEVIIPLLREQFPGWLADKVIDILRLDIRTPEHEILRATMNSLRESNIQTDAERVRDLLDQSGAGVRAVTGLEKTMGALVRGQVNELLISASLDDIATCEDQTATLSADASVNGDGRASRAEIANALISLAVSTRAAITFIEDGKLLGSAGGVGAFLRYQV